VVIPCRRVHQGQLEESGMAPHCWSWVLDHLVVVNRVSWISQEKGIEDLEGIKVHIFSTSSSGITYSGSICCSRWPRAFLNTCVSTFPTKYQSRLTRRWRTNRLVLEYGDHQTCCSILNWWDHQADRLCSPPSGEYGSGEGLVLSQIAELLRLLIGFIAWFDNSIGGAHANGEETRSNHQGV